MKLPQTLAAMPARTKIAFAGAALAFVVALFLLLRMAGAPSYTILAAGLDPADTGKITAVLDEQAIAYELQANGTTVAVEENSMARARVALAEGGVSTGSAAGPGFELFDNQKLGASDFQQQVTYQRALEGEIARTIGSVSGVNGAQVQLVLPQDDLFADSSTPATAAVLLEGSTTGLDAGAVRGIAQLTASSVKGLKSENVTFTDGDGRLLWPQGEGAGGLDGAAYKQAAQASYAAGLEARLNSMLTRTLGPGKAQVQVNADLNMDKVTKDTLTYAKTGVPLKTADDTETLRGSGSTAGGTAGTAGNIPAYAQGGSGSGGTSNYKHSVKSTDFGYDKTVAKVEQAPGAINKLSVALITDSSVKNAAAIKSAVAAAAGIDPQRGDTITQASVAFPKQTTPKTGPVPTGLIGPLKAGALGLAALLFLFAGWRALRKREKEALADPAWLREINEPVSLAELEAGAQTRELAPIPTRAKDAHLTQLEGLVDQEPERVAAQVRQWMDER